MNLINERYDKVVCICLREREDKYKYALAQFIKYDIQVEFYRPVIPGYAYKFTELYAEKHNNMQINRVLFNKQFPNELGAMQSHYTVIKSALLEGANSIFVFEDDCAFHKNFNELLPKYFDTLPEDTEGVLLYSYMANLEPQNIRVKPRWTKGFASWSFLAYGLNKRAMEGYIALQDSQPMISDKASWIMMTHLGYNFYIASPPLIIPSKNLTSSIRGENKNYEKTPLVGGNIFMIGINTNDYE
jgi:GR25 family glycosyltransferase involved in LPS biosynthesis